ncbi:MAG: Regulatory protein Spx [Smithella sp. PtaU1.Bin162]|nr:MAG: Regulatory protein Spx [Smithella sp. PtaU1.Bin162]
MTKYLLLFTAVIFMFWGTAQADFYKWEDENGNIVITDYPPPVKPGKKIRLHNYDSANILNEEEKQSEQKNKVDVILYTKNSCNDCDKAREFLKSKKIPYTEYNTDNDKEAAERRKAIDDTEDSPLTIINKNQVYGFSENIYNRLLKIKP